jgi:pimeloyl-ACP methyl ester carboxylesterase
VTVRSTKDNTSRLTITDDKGAYRFSGLPTDTDYAVRADFQGSVSETSTVSALLNREDNLVNFKLSISAPARAATNATAGAEMTTFDLVKLYGTFELPRAGPAPIPSVLLLHGYGEDRNVWQDFKDQLVARGWAVLALDLRGHGQSTVRNQKTFAATTEWRTSPHEFPHDIDPALDFLKAQPRLDSRRIVVIGYDVGANLALFASGKFQEVRTVVAVKPDLKESLLLAGSAQDFQPRSALVVADETQAGALKTQIQTPARFLTLPTNGGATAVFKNKQLTDAIMAWLKETF